MIIEALLIGAFVGIVVGSLGAGGGILSVPILVYILGQDPHQATGLSLIIVGLTAAVSLATRARSGNVAWREGSLFALVGLAGTWAGSTLGPLVSARALMLSFCALLGAVAVFMVRSQLRPSASLSPNEAGDSSVDKGSWTLGTVSRVVALATLTGFLTGFFGV
ncbi:MAG: sulfite exporter TauE/SafE family protein, partial [Actinomyces sp.]|nr:sulfite exporter TauE/SafE family protein [Actinomyces sp.]